MFSGRRPAASEQDAGKSAWALAIAKAKEDAKHLKFSIDADDVRIDLGTWMLQACRPLLFHLETA